MNDLGEMHGHLTDLRRIIRGIEVFAGQTFQQMREHYELHQEDKLCDVSRPDGRGIVPCTRDALQCLSGSEPLWFAKTLADFEINDIAALPPLRAYTLTAKGLPSRVFITSRIVWTTAGSPSVVLIMAW